MIGTCLAEYKQLSVNNDNRRTSRTLGGTAGSAHSSAELLTSDVRDLAATQRKTDNQIAKVSNDIAELRGIVTMHFGILRNHEGRIKKPEGQEAN